MIFASGARQFVVQEALERISMSLVYLSRLTPQTNMGASAFGASVSIPASKWEDIYRRSRDDDFLSTALEMSFALLGGGEDTRGLDDVLGTRVFPGDVGGVTLLVHLDDFFVDD
jgi:hypothetical protein